MIVSLLQKSIFLFRSILYYWNIRKSIALSARTISVGNISFGGSGKTTLVSFIAKSLLAANESVVILSRGYKRKSKDTFVIPPMQALPNVEDIGDEPYMLKKNLAQASLVVARDRIKEAKKSWELIQSKYVLLDDGFQHWRAERDLDIVLFNLKQWGKLGREALEASARAHCFVFTQFENIEKEKIKDIVRNLIKFSFKKKWPWQREIASSSFPSVFFLRYRALGLFQGSKLIHPREALSQKKVILLHGLASQSSIQASVERLGICVLKEFSFSDHHWIKKEEVQRIYNAFEKIRKEFHEGSNPESDSPLLLCTEKDYYRWLKAFSFCQKHFYYLKIEAEFSSPISMEGVIGGENDFLRLIKRPYFVK